MRFLGIPFSAGGLGKTKGCEKAPEKIFKLLKVDSKILDVDNNNISETNEKINVELQKELPSFIVGGDHSITYSCVKAFKDKFTDVGMIIFDAHPDVENNFSPPTHEDYLKVLIEEGVVDPSNIILIGEREGTVKEKEFLKLKGVLSIDMNMIKENGIEEVCSSVMEKARSFSDLYISVDIDAVDPAFAPGTGYICPGGLSSQDMLYFVSRLKLLNNLKCVDLVEINPEKDVNDLTINLGVSILKKFFT